MYIENSFDVIIIRSYKAVLNAFIEDSWFYAVNTEAQ